MAEPHIASSLAALMRARVELALVELREQAELGKDIIVFAAAGGIFLAIAVLLLALFVVVLFWDTHRVEAAAAVTLTCFAMGAIALALLRRRRREGPPPFQATLAELAADILALRGRHE